MPENHEVVLQGESHRVNDPEFEVVLDRMKKNRIDGARAILHFEVFKGRLR
jgi:hypothetical protein